MSPEQLVLGILWFLAFLLSTTCHEAAHALVARIGGDWTAARAGQVSLSPMPHIRREPWGMVLIPILSYFLFFDEVQGGWMLGWASAPYDVHWRMQHPRRAGAMALAGPGANLLLVVLAGVLIAVGFRAGWFVAPPGGPMRFDAIVVAAAGTAADGVATFLSILFSLNVILFAFNLMPVPPLDGATAVGLVLPPELARRWTALSLMPSLSLVAFLLAWFVFPSYVLSPIFRAALRGLYALA